MNESNSHLWFVEINKKDYYRIHIGPLGYFIYHNNPVCILLITDRHIWYVCVGLLSVNGYVLLTNYMWLISLPWQPCTTMYMVNFVDKLQKSKDKGQPLSHF